MEQETKLKCLIVDPDVFSLREIKLFITEHPRLELIMTCKTGRAAANCLKNEQPDLIILNPALPDINGFDLIADMPDPPPVIVVADRMDYAYYAYRIGAFDYRVKPVKTVQFEQSLGRVLRAIDQDRRLKALEGELDALRGGKENA